jgi:hypothetical protein
MATFQPIHDSLASRSDESLATKGHKAKFEVMDGADVREAEAAAPLHLRI